MINHQAVEMNLDSGSKSRSSSNGDHTCTWIGNSGSETDKVK